MPYKPSLALKLFPFIQTGRTMKKLTILGGALLLISSSHAQINFKDIKVPDAVKDGISIGTGTNSSLSESEIINGLKEALTKGATNASLQLNKENGYLGNSLVRIPFPEDCQKVATKLRSMGYGSKVDKFEQTLNRAAEQAAKEAAPIFINAVKQMTFADAKNILFGADTAATFYLRQNTNSALYTAFAPHIKKALDETTATAMWDDLARTYNKLPFAKKVETDLVKYTTNKGLKGLFVVVGQEEQKIRKDPAARTSDLLKKVFGEAK